MSRLLVIFSLTILLFSVSRAVPAPKGSSEKPYLPTIKGSVRVYQWTTSDDKGRPDQSEVTEVVTAVQKTDAGLVVTVSQQSEGSEFGSTNTFLQSKMGLFTTGASMTGADIKGELRWKIEPPACLLKLPHKDGAKWEYYVKAQSSGLVGAKATNTAKSTEEVVVPAGKYQAIRVEQCGTTNGEETATTFWYAPEVGLVKMVGGGVVQELKSFTPER